MTDKEWEMIKREKYRKNTLTIKSELRNSGGLKREDQVG